MRYLISYTKPQKSAPRGLGEMTQLGPHLEVGHDNTDLHSCFMD